MFLQGGAGLRGVAGLTLNPSTKGEECCASHTGRLTPGDKDPITQ
jgi:hypothetical protein